MRTPGLRILVVDDDEPSATALRGLLATDGHEAIVHTSGGRGVAELARGRFDAVVTDLEMPDVDGHAVVRAARALPICTIVVTGCERPSDIARVQAAGACKVLRKPLDYHALAEALDCEACRRRGAFTPAR